MPGTGMKIFFVGWFGSGNMGDEAILRAELLYFRAHLPAVEFSILSFQPERTQRLTADIPEVKKIVKMGTKHAVLTSQFRELLKTLRGVDVVIVGGGGLFQDIYNHYPIPFFTLITWLAHRYRKRVVLYCLGIGPIRTWFGKTLTRFAANLSDVLSVRDVESKTWLERSGVSKPICLAADPVLLLPAEYNDKVEKILRTYSIDGERPTILVCVHELIAWNQSQGLFAAVLDAVIQRHQANVVFLPFGAYRNTWFSGHSGDTVDLAAAKNVRAHVREPSFLMTEELTPQELLSVIGKTALVISMRFHGLVMGLCMGVPVIALTFRRESKLRELMRRLKQEENLFDASALECDRFLAQIESLLSEKIAMKPQIEETVGHLKFAVENCTAMMIQRLKEEVEHDR
jgi:polysaccharide pyruvyl transferase CsaB